MGHCKELRSHWGAIEAAEGATDFQLFGGDEIIGIRGIAEGCRDMDGGGDVSGAV